MSIVRYEPWNLLNQLQRDIDTVFENRLGRDNGEGGAIAATSDWTPAVDIKEEQDRYVIHADVPGVDPKDIEVDMEGGVLTIKGERESEKKDEREGYKRVERIRGTFFRRFSLPDTVDAEKISAKARNGVLEVIVPKHEKVQPRKIKVEG